MRAATPRSRLCVLAAVLCASAIGAVPGTARAAQRVCGSDAIANTAAVLCAPPSGPCTATDVVMSANIELPTGGCELNLGGRTLRVERTLQMIGSASLIVNNAGAITITPTGKLKARGDYLRPSGQIGFGGEFILESNTTITHAGLIDVTGDVGGGVIFSADGDIALESGSSIVGRGFSSFFEYGGRLGDGGSVELFSAGSARARGEIDVAGTSRGAGGFVYVQAFGDVTIDRRIDASGGTFDGGEIEIDAGRALTVRATLSVESRSGGGFGGVISLLGGLGQDGGSVTIDGAALQLNGSSWDGFGGEGGELVVAAYGPIRMHGAGAAIHANAGDRFDGSGGRIYFEASNLPTGRDGDLSVEAPITAVSGGSGGRGGSVSINADEDVVMAGALNAFGKEGGGDLFAFVGGDFAFRGIVDLSGKDIAASPGYVVVQGGRLHVGTITVDADLRTYGGSKGYGFGAIQLSSCALRVAPGIKIDGTGGETSGFIGGSFVTLKARQPLLLGGGARFLGGPGGRVETIHPPGQDPVIGPAVVFAPARIDTVATDDTVFAPCPAP